MSAAVVLQFLLSGGALAVSCLAYLQTRLKDSAGELVTRIRYIVGEMIQGTDSRVSILETKMDVFWKNVAFDAASILHSPHPERAELDNLLERFQAETLTLPETSRLQEMLTDIMNGMAKDFTVGDRVAAAIVLRGIEQRSMMV